MKIGNFLIIFFICGSCGKSNEQPSPSMAASYITIGEDIYIQKETATLTKDDYLFSAKLLSLQNNSEIDLVVYFRDQIMSGNNLLYPTMVCQMKEKKYSQMSITEGEVTILPIDDNSRSLVFDKCKFGENSYISGCFTFNFIQRPTPEKTINIWGKEHPFKQWINPGTPQWIGSTLLNIQNTELTIYQSKNRNKPSPVVLICPGGAYSCLSAVHEGSAVAEWFAEQGITAAVLYYCLPNGHPEIPLSDAQEAVRYLRGKYATLKINPNQVGVIGFSAGGHLASLLATQFNVTDGIGVANSDVIDESRPDFAIFCYPVITMSEPYTHIGTRENLLGLSFSNKLINICSTERHITSETPPTLLFHSEDDHTVLIQNSQMYHDSLLHKGGKSRLVTFSIGGHGWGFNNDYKYSKELRIAIIEWLSEDVFVN